MSRLKREGNPPSGQLASPVPQAWDPSINDFREITGQNLGGGRFGADGVQWGKTASGLFVPVRVTNDGVQEVQVSGTIVEIYKSGMVDIPAGTNLDAKIDVSEFTEIWVFVSLLVNVNYSVESRWENKEGSLISAQFVTEMIGATSTGKKSDPIRVETPRTTVRIKNNDVKAGQLAFYVFGRRG